LSRRTYSIHGNVRSPVQHNANICYTVWNSHPCGAILCLQS